MDGNRIGFCHLPKPKGWTNKLGTMDVGRTVNRVSAVKKKDENRTRVLADRRWGNVMG